MSTRLAGQLQQVRQELWMGLNTPWLADDACSTMLSSCSSVGDWAVFCVFKSAAESHLLSCAAVM